MTYGGGDITQTGLLECCQRELRESAPGSDPLGRPRTVRWRELIRKVYEVDPLTCPACGARMKVIAFITNYAVIDKIIHHLGVTFTYERPPPAPQQEELY